MLLSGKENVREIQRACDFTVDVSRTYSGEWNMEKEMAASENVEDLRLELSKEEDEKLFAEVSDVFGGDDTTTTSAIDEQEHSHDVDENSLVGVNDSPEVLLDNVILCHTVHISPPGC